MKKKYEHIDALNKRWNSDFKSFKEIKDVWDIIHSEWAPAMTYCMDNGEVTGIRNKNGNSEVVWIPSGIALGARLHGNAVLSRFLADELTAYTASQPFGFAEKTNNVVMQTMHDGQTWLTVITNGSDAINKVSLVNKLKMKANIFFCTDINRKEINTEDEIQLQPKECLVLMWKDQ